MRQYNVIDIPVGIDEISVGDLARRMANVIDPIKVRKFYKVTYTGQEQHREELLKDDYDLLMIIFQESSNLLVDNVSQRKSYKLKYFNSKAASYSKTKDLFMFRGVCMTDIEIQKCLNIHFNATIKQLKFICLLHEMKKIQWSIFYEIFINSDIKPKWMLKAYFSDEDNGWTNRRKLTEDKILSEINVAFFHEELGGVLTEHRLETDKIIFTSLLPIDKARDYAHRHGFLLQENTNLSTGKTSGIEKNVQICSWIEPAIKIYQSLMLIPGNKKFSIKQMAIKVQKEMQIRFNKGDKKMAKRGGREVPKVDTIIRHALSKH